MNKEEAIKKFNRWRRVQEGFVFQHRGGKWDCCSRESPIGNALATEGAGKEVTANIMDFEAVTQDPNDVFPPEAEADQAAKAERSAAPKRRKRPRAKREPRRRAPAEADTSQRSRPRFKRSLILIGILLMIGGPFCVWIQAGMTANIDKILNMKITLMVIIGVLAVPLGFIVLVVNLLRSGGASAVVTE